MELDQIRLVLVLAEELHFGRTAERSHVSQPRVSKQVAAVERELGGALFDRSSRRVRLTPLGQQFVDRVGLAYRDLLDAIDQVTDTGRPEIRVSFLPSTGGVALSRVLREFERRHPETIVQPMQVSYADPYAALRDANADVLVFWRINPEPGITVGPAIDRQERMAMLSTEHPLADRPAVSVLDVDNWAEAVKVAPPAVRKLFLPLTTRDDTPIPRIPLQCSNLQELVALVAENRIAHATVASVSEIVHRDDIVLVPIHDLAPIDLVIMWVAAHETKTIRSFARVASDISRARSSARRTVTTASTAADSDVSPAIRRFRVDAQGTGS